MVQSREWTYDGRNGSLVARSWSGSDEPTHVVVLAHGYGEHIGRYERIADALVCNGAAVHAVDHVGHGKSEGERVLVQEFDPQVPGSARDHPGQVLGRRLGHGVEQGVPATDVRLERMLDPDPIAELHLMMVARTAAIGRVRPRREERAEDAVLHVEHREDRKSVV